MPLFGRRKPGFAKEEIIRKDEIPGEFSDALDPAVRQDAPEASEKPELCSYLQSLPDVEDTFPPFPEEEPATAPAEKTRAEVLADFIRERTRGSLLTGRRLLEREDEDLEALLAGMAASASCGDIASIEGSRDVYYYSDALMTKNYAHIAMLVEEKDMPRTIAEMVRFNCKTYPAATPEAYFSRHPYFMTAPQIARALDAIARDPQYADIRRVNAFNGVPYLYSTLYFTDKYGKAMANYGEEDESNS